MPKVSKAAAVPAVHTTPIPVIPTTPNSTGPGNLLALVPSLIKFLLLCLFLSLSLFFFLARGSYHI